MKIKKVEAVETPAMAEHLIVLMGKDVKTIEEFLRDLKDKKSLPFFHQQVVDVLNEKEESDIFLKMTEIILNKKESSLAELRAVGDWNFKNNTEYFLNKLS